MIRRIAALLTLPLLLMLVVVALVISTPESTPDTYVRVASSATPSLPVCVTEDGAGQALCTWDAQAQGNGLGEAITSGDCAYETQATRTVCVNLHARESVTIEGQNGASNTIPNGSDLVAECQEELQVGRDDWTDESMRECFNAWLNN